MPSSPTGTASGGRARPWWPPPSPSPRNGASTSSSSASTPVPGRPHGSSPGSASPLKRSVARLLSPSSDVGSATASAPSSGWSPRRVGGRSRLPCRAAALTEPTPRLRVVSTHESRSRLLLLDGHSLAYRAFFALPVENFSTTDGQPTNAVYG